MDGNFIMGCHTNKKIVKTRLKAASMDTLDVTFYIIKSIFMSAS